jgi:predicted transcriptional regulator
MTKTASIRLPDSTWAKLRFLGERDDRLPSELIRDAVGLFLDGEDCDCDWDNEDWEIFMGAPLRALRESAGVD